MLKTKKLAVAVLLFAFLLSLAACNDMPVDDGYYDEGDYDAYYGDEETVDEYTDEGASETNTGFADTWYISANLNEAYFVINADGTWSFINPEDIGSELIEASGTYGEDAEGTMLYLYGNDGEEVVDFVMNDFGTVGFMPEPDYYSLLPDYSGYYFYREADCQ